MNGLVMEQILTGKWERILGVIHDLGGSATTDEIWARVPNRSRPAIVSVVKSLRKREWIVTDANGVHSLNCPWPLPPTFGQQVIANPLIEASLTRKERNHLKGLHRGLVGDAVRTLAQVKDRLDASIVAIDEQIERDQERRRRATRDGGWISEGVTPPPPKGGRK